MPRSVACHVSRRHVAVTLLPLVTLLLGAPVARAEDPPPPNFVLILADDLGYADLGCQGNDKAETPRLDRMAAEGLRLTSYYTASVCAPARAALLTGRYSFRAGVVRNLEAGTYAGLPPREVTLARALARKGYATACLGKWHLGEAPHRRPTDHGFQTFVGTLRSNSMRPPWTSVKRLPRIMRNDEQIGTLDDATNPRLTHLLTEEAVVFIHAHRTQPFFLYVSHYMPHIPLGTVAPFLGRSKSGLYGDVVETLDWSTGQILDALKECDLDERTLVVFTSDNGPRRRLSAKECVGGVEADHCGETTPLRGSKGDAQEGGMRVPCLVRWPGRIPAGRVSDGITCMVDLFPTFLAYAGAKAPAGRVIDGLDLGGFLEGKADDPRHEYQYWVVNDLEALRVDQWKVRHLLEGDRMALLDLAKDPGEREDLAAQEPERLHEMTRLLRERRQEVREDPTRSRLR